MIKSMCCLVLASMLSFYTYAQSNINPEQFKSVSIDSCVSWMKENTYNMEIGTLYHDISLQTLKRASKNSDNQTLADIHETISSWHAYYGIFSPDSVVHHSEKTLEFYKKLDNKKKIADTYRILAVDYINVRNLEKSQEVLFKAIALYEASNDTAGLGKAYSSLSSLHQVMEEPEKTIKYARKAIEIFEQNENYASIAIAHFNITDSYGKLGEYDKAFKSADYCIEIAETKVPEEVFIATRAYSFRGDIGIKTKDYQRALKDYIRSWEICVAKAGEERCATYRAEIGEVYLLQENYAEALEHIKSGVDSYEEQGKNASIKSYQNLSKIYEKLGDYKNALFYENTANTHIKNELEGKIKNLEDEAIIKYETGKKDEALASQSALLTQKNKTQTLIIAIAVLLGLLLLSLLYFFNKNRKATKIISTKNAENELLLKEIHHRVKNNLEMVKSLIALQSAQIDDPTTKDAMIASQNRVQSMGIIHQKLYQGDNLGSIEMKDYFLNLSEGILDTFNVEDKVTIKCAMNNLDLDIDTAVPIGLIVNELLTNALKYAFPDKTKGEISISLEKTNESYLKLIVEDNGIGKTKDLAPQGTGFGSQLVNLLTQQLNGKMTERIGQGTAVEFEFKMDTAA